MRLLPPTPVLSDPSWVGRPSDLTAEQLRVIEGHGDVLMSLEGMDGMVGGPLKISAVAPAIRRSRIVWIPQPNPQTDWIYSVLEGLVLEANARHWNFHLAGFYDSLQYTVYRGEDEGHYSWHQDKFAGELRPQRKLGFSLLLSDPDTYDGGDLEINDGVPLTLPHKERGAFICFPSYVLHRVTPVTRGVRKSLVGWVSGPRFV